MTSQLAWLDSSDSERRKALAAVLDLFKSHETRDELGIGSVRDTFANELFPGTSVIQTRARYLLFIPWIYQHIQEQLETANLSAQQIATLARSREVELIEALRRGNAGGGIIGRVARRDVVTLPSSIYWTGLDRWGIRRNEGSVADYHRDLADGRSRHDFSTEEEDDLLTQERPWWHINLPSSPDDFLDETNLRLTKIEADYLTDLITTSCADSLLSHLVNRTRPQVCKFPWQHPQFGQFPAQIRNTLQQAERFSLVMHGAGLLYNLLLADKKESKEEKEEPLYYEELLDKWWREIRNSKERIRERKFDTFWEDLDQFRHNQHQGSMYDSVRRIPKGTVNFCKEWIKLVDNNLRAATWKKLKIPAKDLITHRELRLKKSRARLTNQRALENWEGDAGTRQLDYRWSVVQGLVKDILTPQKQPKK